MPPTTHRKLQSLVVLVFLAATAFGQDSTPKKKIQTQKIVEQGVAIEFTAEPLVQNVNSIRAAEDVNVRFTVTDTTTRSPVKNFGLSAWISTREGNTEPTSCHEK